MGLDAVSSVDMVGLALTHFQRRSLFDRLLKRVGRALRIENMEAMIRSRLPHTSDSFGSTAAVGDKPRECRLCAKPPFGMAADQLLLSDQAPAPTKRDGGATALTALPAAS
jgi:hypothetical protein